MKNGIASNDCIANGNFKATYTESKKSRPESQFWVAK